MKKSLHLKWADNVFHSYKKPSLNKKTERLINALPMSTKSFNSIAIQDVHGLIFISPLDIRYSSSKGSYTKVNLTNNKMVTVSKNLKEIQLLLGDEFFVRIHHSHLINLKHAKKYINTDGCFVQMDNDVKLSVSRNKRPDLLKRFKRL